MKKSYLHPIPPTKGQRIAHRIVTAVGVNLARLVICFAIMGPVTVLLLKEG